MTRPWTRSEDLRLRAAILRGLPVRRIAEVLGRTAMSVRARASRLGLALGRASAQVRASRSATPL